MSKSINFGLKVNQVILFTIQKCRRVFGVELIASAVEDARKNAENNGLTNTVFVSGKAEEMLYSLIKQIDEDESSTSATPEKIVAVLDPPRAGLRNNSFRTPFLF